MGIAAKEPHGLAPTLQRCLTQISVSPDAAGDCWLRSALYARRGQAVRISRSAILPVVLGLPEVGVEPTRF